MSNTLISIEGNIGSGKSTLLNALKVKFSNNDNVIFLNEPVDEWNEIKDDQNVTILEHFYQDKKRYSFAFQMLAYISRLKNLQTALETHSNKIIISERSLNSDKMIFAKMLYDSGDLEPIMYKIYNEWVSSFSEIKPSKMIYLKTSSSICYLRIASRNRQGEDLIPIDYIERCNEYHENMIKSVSGEVDVITLNGNIDIFKLGSFNEWTKDISDFVEDIYHISDYIINV